MYHKLCITYSKRNIYIYILYLHNNSINKIFYTYKPSYYYYVYYLEIAVHYLVHISTSIKLKNEGKYPEVNNIELELNVM